MREVEWCDGDKHIMLGLLRMATKLCITVLSSLKLTISMHGSFFLRQCMVSFQKGNSTGTGATRNLESKNGCKCRTSTGFLKPHKISNNLQP